MKFCIVTPCLNAERYIERTMRSVVTQTALLTSTGNSFLEYIICDGGSIDATLAIANQIIHDSSTTEDRVSIRIYSESDSGMYDAISKGFGYAGEADVYAYINAGDVYSSHAFEILEQVFAIDGVDFITGFDVVYNEYGHMVSCRLPYGYDRSLVDAGIYGRFLPHIQQESTFWTQSLHQKVDFDKFRQFKLAGDAYLWSTFIRHAKLYVVSAWLAGFTIHAGQLSQNRADDYRLEHLSLCRRLNPWDFVLAGRALIVNYLPDAIKKSLAPYLIIYDHSVRRYRIRG
ncbi:glycosyltransferase [Haliea sp.]